MITKRQTQSARLRHQRSAPATAGTPTPALPDRFVRMLVLVTLVVLSVFGVASPFRYNVLPVDSILDVLLVASVVLLIGRRDTRTTPVVLITLLFLGVNAGVMLVASPAPGLEFMRANLAFIYLICLTYFAGRDLFRVQDIALLAQVMIACAVVKYGYSRIFDLDLKMADRPGFLTENNYELALLMLLFYVAAPGLKRWQPVWFLALTGAVALSGSRSAALELVILFVALYFRPRSRWSYFAVLGTALVGVIGVIIFGDRLGDAGIRSIDRVKFLTVFLNEIATWNPLTWLFGTTPLTPLHNTSCSALAYYQSLFSDDGSGRCYSVILHSYLLRLVFDHGILGVIILVGGLIALFRVAKLSARTSLTILAIGAANSLSVSGFNSIYVAFGIAIALSTRSATTPSEPPMTPARRRLARAERRHAR